MYSTGKTKVVDIRTGGFAYMQEKWLYNEFCLDYNRSDLEEFENHIKLCHLTNRKVDFDIVTSDWLKTTMEFNKENYVGRIREAYLKALSHKQCINGIYGNRIKQYGFGSEYNIWRYNILVNNQKECLDRIFDEKLYASFHYKSLGSGYYVDKHCKNIDWLESHIINLFNGYCYTTEQAKKTCEIINKYATRMR